MQALAILFGAAFTVAASLALGNVLLRGRVSDLGVQFVTGAAILSGAVFGLCAVGLAYPAVFLAVGAAAIVWGRPQLAFTKTERLPHIAAAAFVVFLVLYFFNAMAPEISFDGSRYHLGLVGRYLREHGFHPITDNLYASLSQGIELLFLFAYAFGRHSAAAMVHLAFLLALAWMVWSYACRTGHAVAGICAALLVFASPVVGVDASSAYNDVAVAAIAFALFYLLQIWGETRAPRLLAAIGLVAGFAYAAKYTAWTAVPYVIGWVVWKGRRWREAAIVAIGACVLVAPWMAKNWVFVRNPVAPFFNRTFPNPYVTADFEREYREHMSHYDLKSRWEIPMQVTTHGSLSGLLGPVFLLSPLALMSLRRREGRQLLLAAAVFGMNYFNNIGTRFLIPSLAFVALAMMLALERWPRAALAIAVVHAVISWPTVVKRYCRFDAWRLDKVTYREALRIKPEDGFLESNLPFYGAVRMIERETPPDATVFAFTPIPEAYTSRKVRVAYQAAENVALRDRLWAAARAPDLRRKATAELRRRGVTHLIVFDGEIGADEFRGDPGGWSIRVVGEYKGARLYELQ